MVFNKINRASAKYADIFLEEITELVWECACFDAVIPDRVLSTAIHSYCLVPRLPSCTKKTESICSQSFAVASSVTWNSLSAELWTLNLSIAMFAERLETYLINSYWLQPAAHLLCNYPYTYYYYYYYCYHSQCQPISHYTWYNYTVFWINSLCGIDFLLSMHILLPWHQ